MGDIEQRQDETPVVVRVAASMADVDAVEWDACALGTASSEPSSRPHNPVISHAFLAALEESRSASRATGWLFGRFFGKAEDESQWEPIEEHAAPAIATAEAMSKPAPPRMAAE